MVQRFQRGGPKIVEKSRALAKFVEVSYSTGWLMLNKLPKAMAERNS
ncbi:unnamed protein product [Acidithrix sp. C25]|nr:unnamed protein product [Acidithrix sp. C25]